MARPLDLYRTFVIRCWQEQWGQPGSCAYRFSLEIPVTGKRFGFTRSEDLIQALQVALTEIQVQAIVELPSSDDSQTFDLT